MSTQELDYFEIGRSLGGQQTWFPDPLMYLGGCAAVTACDCSIYFARYRNRPELYPFDVNHLTKRDFVSFGRRMKPYLRPRNRGIDKLSIYTEGITKYWHDCGVSDLSIEELEGTTPYSHAKKAICQQLDAAIPIPYLLLYHKNRNFKDFQWHWFILAGYQEFEDTLLVKAITYGTFFWLDFYELWHTGHGEKGGAILIQDNRNNI